MSNKGRVVSTNISSEKGIAKNSVAKIILNELGVVNDAHAGFTNRNVSILSIESIKNFNQKTGMNIQPGEFAENLTLEGINLSKLKLGDQLKTDDTILEVTQIGKECHGEGCAIFQKVGKCAMPTEGVFCRVVQTGVIQAGEIVEVVILGLARGDDSEATNLFC